MNEILFKNALILDGERAFRGSLLVRGSQIAEIRAGTAEIATNGRVIDGKGKILMPALFNSHTHAAMTLFRGAGTDLPLKNWLFDVILPLEQRLTPELVYVGTQLAILEMLRFGTAGFLDMYYFMDEACRAAVESGIRMTAAWPSKPENIRRLFADYNGSSDGRINVIGALHAEYTSSPEEIEDAVDFIRTNKLPAHVHISETKDETERCIAQRGKTPAAFLAEAGLFEYGGSAAHCVWLNGGDINLLKERNVSVSHCPVSNLKLGSGVMNLAKYLREGLSVSLGTDGCASNNTLNLFEEIRFAALLQKGVSGDAAAVSAKDVFRMATLNGARACGLGESGVIRENAKADLILVDTDVPHAHPMTDPYAHIAYCAQGSDVLLTMVDGNILYENGSYTTLDKEAILRRAEKAKQALEGN